MNILSSILSKLGIGEAEAAAAPSTDSVPASAPKVDVVVKLAVLADSHVEKLNWNTSIVDLLKLLGLESSLASPEGACGRTGLPGCTRR